MPFDDYNNDMRPTLQWWIDRARQLEDYSGLRDKKILGITLERNKAYFKRDKWKEIASALYDAYQTNNEFLRAIAEETFRRELDEDGRLG